MREQHATEVSTRGLEEKIFSLFKEACEEADAAIFSLDEITASLASPHVLHWTRSDLDARRPQNDRLHDLATSFTREVLRHRQIGTLHAEASIEVCARHTWNGKSRAARRSARVADLLRPTGRDLLDAVEEALDARDEEIRALRARLDAARDVVLKLNLEETNGLRRALGQERTQALLAALCQLEQLEEIQHEIARRKTP